MSQKVYYPYTDEGFKIDERWRNRPWNIGLMAGASAAGLLLLLKHGFQTLDLISLIVLWIVVSVSVIIISITFFAVFLNLLPKHHGRTIHAGIAFPFGFGAMLCVSKLYMQTFTEYQAHSFETLFIIVAIFLVFWIQHVMEKKIQYKKYKFVLSLYLIPGAIYALSMILSI